ncbi:MAG: D-aminoacyl-tRNA deacylase [Pseudomonadota bacterium]
MKALIQRTTQASVTVGKEVIASIGPGLLVLVGVEKGDCEKHAAWLAKKVCGLRIFEDSQGKMNLSVLDVEAEILAVSQFTLAADCKKGKRPSFDKAAKPEDGARLFEKFCELCQEEGVSVKTGKFAAHMEVALINDGPVTIMLDTLDMAI